MAKDKKNEIPWIKKESVTIITVGDTGNEPHALRSILEWLNYRVDVLWIGSRKEFLEVLKGTIPTAKYIIFSVHGIDEGIAVPDETAVSPNDITKEAKLESKTVINLGCGTGTDEYASAFKSAGVKGYIAPTDYPLGSATSIFINILFYELSLDIGKSLKEAFGKAQSFSNETGMFNLHK